MLNNVQSRVTLGNTTRHQYELPFVFAANNVHSSSKPVAGPSGLKHNDSTAF